MTEEHRKLRTGWTTGACATAAVRAALLKLWGGAFPDSVTIRLPRGQTPEFPVAYRAEGEDWAEAGIVKDAGDDPDVTHGVEVRARVRAIHDGIRFVAGQGVGTVTKPGLPIPPGEPAINPVPRKMIEDEIHAAAAEFGRTPAIEVTISIPGGDEIAARTWNPRLGIKGGLSVLGTTGIVRPFSCSAWIASIHRGIDVARAEGLAHLAGATGSASEAAVQMLHGLPDGAMIDMGDFVGGMLKYLRGHPVRRVTIGGGIGKMTKLAQGAADLHSGRSQVDFAALARDLDDPRLANANTALEAFQIAGQAMADQVARGARDAASRLLGDPDCTLDVVVVDRSGRIIARSGT